MKVRVFTGFPPGYQYESIGIVTATEVIGAGLFRDFVARLKDTLGGHIGSIQGMINDAMIRLTSELMRKASSMGGDTVAGIEFDSQVISTSRGGVMVMVVAYGTACRTLQKGKSPPLTLAHDSEDSDSGVSFNIPKPPDNDEEENIDTWFR